MGLMWVNSWYWKIVFSRVAQIKNYNNTCHVGIIKTYLCVPTIQSHYLCKSYVGCWHACVMWAIMMLYNSVNRAAPCFNFAFMAARPAAAVGAAAAAPSFSRCCWSAAHAQLCTPRQLWRFSCGCWGHCTERKRERKKISPPSATAPPFWLAM